jgi:hypothetical protein
MKNILYVSAALMVAIWILIHFAFHVENAFILLVMAAIIVLIRLVFNKQLDRY